MYQMRVWREFTRDADVGINQGVGRRGGGGGNGLGIMSLHGLGSACSCPLTDYHSVTPVTYMVVLPVT